MSSDGEQESSSSSSSGGSPDGDVLVVAGSYENAGSADGEYTLIDGSATGTDRVWRDAANDYEIRSFMEGTPMWAICATSSGSYVHYVYHDDTDGAITKDDGSSFIWYYQGRLCSMTVTKKA